MLIKGERAVLYQPAVGLDGDKDIPLPGSDLA